MKRIEAVIKPYKLEDVKDALDEIGVRGLTVFALNACDHNIGPSLVYRSTERHRDFIAKVYLELIAEDKDVDTIVSSILESARSDELDEGKIIISDVDRVIRIRTGEADSSAL